MNLWTIEARKNRGKKKKKINWNEIYTLFLMGRPRRYICSIYDIKYKNLDSKIRRKKWVEARKQVMILTEIKLKKLLNGETLD